MDEAARATHEISGRGFAEDKDPADPVHLASIARAFHLTDDPARFDPPPPADHWDRSVANIEGYLHHFARQFLERGALHNAAKHGLAIRPTEMSMKWNDGSVLSAEGPVIQYLEVVDRPGGPRWFQVSHWVSPDQQMALVYIACQLITMLWTVARFRYFPRRREDSFQVPLFNIATIEELLLSDLASDEGAIVIEDMKMQLLYYAPDTGAGDNER